MSFEYILAICVILLGFAIAYQDLRTQQISTRYLMGFAALSLENYAVNWPHTDFLGLAIMSILLGMIFLYERFRCKILLGSADKILLICCCGWIEGEKASYLLILSGILGVLTAGIFRRVGRRTQLQEKTFPFAPPILVSLLVLALT